MMMGMPKPSLANVLAVALLGGALVSVIFAQPQPERDPDAQPTGIFNTRFHERSPLSSRERMAEVGHWRAQQLTEWDINEIEFQMVVPDGYTGEEPYGLLVFIHPSDDITATEPRRFFFGRVIEDVLAEHKLIWVSFDEAGNPVLPNKRMGLALDAVHNITQHFNIDERRIYISGMSGGGRMTCMSAIYYPQIFTGAIPIVGSLYFNEVPIPDDPAQRRLLREQPGENAVWGARLIPPQRRELDRMKREQRWVLLTGAEDFNMPEMRSHFEHGFKHDGFQHAHYLEVPRMGHSYPDADWFERAIVLLDAPLNEVEAGEGDAQNDTPAQRREEAAAQRRLDTSKRHIDRDPDRALRLLRRIVELHPDTRAAEEARGLITVIESGMEGGFRIE